MNRVEVLRDPAGAVHAQPVHLPWLPGHLFWALSTSPGDLGQAERDRLLAAAYAELEARSAGDREAPASLCLLLDPAERARRPALRWDAPPFVHAGYVDDGRQVRIAYVGHERLAVPPPDREGGEWAAGPGYEIHSVPGPVAPEAVVELWVAEGVLGREEAERRAGELLYVATDDARRPVGASTAYLEHNHQLRAPFWYFRAFVAAAHRRSNVAYALAMRGRDELARRFAAGDTSAQGVIWEVENAGLRDRWPLGWWRTPDFVLIGRNDRVDVRLHPFAGALAPANG